MMIVVSLQEAQALVPGSQERQWAYNALDNTGTREVADELLQRLNRDTSRVYAFERALQAPALSMMMRGIRCDEYKRNEMVKELRAELRREERILAKLPGIAD